MRGSIQTNKGETKKMSELTDKEADEWLAEEFREYVLAGGNYNIGNRVKKNFIQRIFDKISEILNFFVNNKSQAQTLMSRINTGYFSNPNRTLTLYDSKTEAYFVYPQSLRNMARVITFRNFLYSKVSKWEF